MKKLLIILATLSILPYSENQAQTQLQALFYQSSFYSPADGPFIETYLKVFGHSAKFIKTENGMYQASLKVEISFLQDNQSIEKLNYNLLSEEYPDTIDIQMSFIDQQRVSLPPGVYQLELSVTDNNRDGAAIELAQMISLDYDDKELKFSGIQLIERFYPTEEENILTKNGYDLIPFVGDFFDERSNTLTFYTEIYNLDDKIGSGEDFLFRYYLESFETNIPISDFQHFQKQKAGEVNVLLATLPISRLPSGNFNLVIEARDRNNNELLMTRMFLMKSNPQVRMDFKDLDALDITATFAQKISDIDSLKFYVGSLTPIANPIERRNINNLLDNGDVETLQKFLFNFWNGINPDYPHVEWEIYKEQVLLVDSRYKTKIMHGHETDQGRIWLKYGAPDDVQNSVHESAEYPYIIWHYYRAGTQMNVKFMFYNPHLVGTEYFLAYTNARGETYDPGWEGLNNRGNNSGNRGSAFWGSRLNSKIIK